MNAVNGPIRLVSTVALALTLLLLGVIAASAQQPAAPPQAAADESLPRWDAAGFIGWRGARIEDTYYSGNRWDARFVGGGTVGYYLTPNLKLEADVSLTPTSRYDEYEQRTFPGVPYPLFIRFDHRTTTAAVGGLVIYQFFENASFHPFLGAGAGVLTARERITADRQTQVFQRAPNVPPEVIVVEEGGDTRSRTDHYGRGLIVAGFKAYPGERVFFRTDVQWSTGQARDISWRLGVGVDF